MTTGEGRPYREAGPLKEASSVLHSDKVRPEIVRGISLRTLMGCACAVLQRSDDEAESGWYGQSRPVESFSYFLSHSWRDGRFSKAIGLSLHVSRRSVVWVSCSLVLIVACLQFFQVVPLPAYSFKVGGTLNRNGVSCLIVGCISWVLFLALAPFLRPSEMWFLDKACICQSDARLKQEGILALGAFLQRSHRMVMLLTPNYFSRGWCTFEVAAMVASRGIGSVEIVPLSRSLLVIYTFPTSMLVTTVFNLTVWLDQSDDSGGASAASQSQFMILGYDAGELLFLCAPSGLVFGIASFIIEHYVAQKQVIVDQVRSFSLEKADFAEASDRTFVTEVIEALFGSVRNFEVKVHTEVYQKIEAEVGSGRWQSIPYDATALGALPYLWWSIDMLCTDPNEVKLVDFFCGTTLTFMVVPLCFAMLAVLAKLKLMWTSNLSRCAQHLASALVCLCSLMFAVITALIWCVYLHAAQHLAWLVWTACALVTFATFADWQGLRRASEGLRTGGADSGAVVGDGPEAPMLPMPAQGG